MGIISKGIRALQRKRVQRALKPKASKKKAVKKDIAQVQSEARAGAKGADRGKKTEQVARRVLPDLSDKKYGKIHSMSARKIADSYDGTEITAMMRKIKDPKLLAKLQKAKRLRTKIGKSFIEQNQGVHQKGYPPVPRKGSRGAELAAKAFKRGGVAKRKAGGKMSTDGNSFVASLYKGGKIGG